VSKQCANSLEYVHPSRGLPWYDLSHIVYRASGASGIDGRHVFLTGHGRERLRS